MPPGQAGNFDDPNSWFETVNQQFGIDVPGEGDTANAVAPVYLVITPGKTDTVSRLRVLVLSKDEDVARIGGSLKVVDEVFLENDRGTRRFTASLTLDCTTDGATMDVDLLHVGGSLLGATRNTISFDDDSRFFPVAGNVQVTTRKLEVLGTGEFGVSSGGSLTVAGPAYIQQGGGAPFVEVSGFWTDPLGTKTGSALLIDGDLRAMLGMSATMPD